MYHFCGNQDETNKKWVKQRCCKNTQHEGLRLDLKAANDCMLTYSLKFDNSEGVKGKLQYGKLKEECLFYKGKGTSTDK
eukprot:6741959-Ditylum_brightwellii.AAC.1